MSFLLSMFLVSGCQNNTSNCVPAGCSSQVCVAESDAEGYVTTCEYKEEYSCLELSNCKFIDEKCQWEQTSEYLECLSEVRG